MRICESFDLVRAAFVYDLKIRKMTEVDSDHGFRENEGAGDSVDSVESGKAVNGDDGILNHVDQNKQNGFPEEVKAGEHKQDGASSKSKEHRDKDRDHKHSSSSDKHKSSSSSDKHKHSSSSSKHHSSSSSSKHRDGHSSSSSSHKHGSSSSSSKHREGHSSSSKDKHSSSGHSSSKDKEGDKDKHRSSEKHSSSSSDKHKHSSSSSSKHSSDKPRDKEGENDKHNSSSKKENLDSDKEKERRERKEKERQERKERERKERKEKERQERKEKEQKERESQDKESLSVKKEPISPVKEKSSPVKPKIEPESEDEDDIPLSARLKQETDDIKPVKREKDLKPVKRERVESDDDDEDVPLSARMAQVKKVKKEKPTPTKPSPPSGKKRKAEPQDSDEDEKPLKKKKSKTAAKTTTPTSSPTKKKKGAKEEPQEVWKWWEEEKAEGGVKWTFLEHKGPVFAPEYEPLPDEIKFYYDGKVMRLSEETEEVATFYAKMLDHDYTTKEVFNNNFFKDWRKVMTPEEKKKIKDLKKCNFRDMCEYFKQESEKRKNRSKEEKLKLKEENAAKQEEYGFCIMDSHREKIGNFRIEPPSLFRGRGEHPKQGMLKRRVQPEDVIINCSKDSKIPEPLKGHKWKKVQHDNKVTWLASWTENIQGQIKYMMLNPSSRLKGEMDWQKYETARCLHKCVDKIRANYQEDWTSNEMRVRQRAVAMYLIDKLALRAGNEKEEGETADTVGCCSLREEHISLHNEKDGKSNVVEFDFLGKDCIRYQNVVPVEEQVFKNLQIFMENKAPGDDLFDRLNTTILNKHLQELMEGLTAKVIRTYNASRTLQEQLDLMTNDDDAVPAKMLSYNRANWAVAILCNHQRAAPKNFSKQMENLMSKIKDKRGQVKEAKKQLKEAKAAFKSEKTQKNKMVHEKKKMAYKRLEEQLTKLEVQATNKEENKEIALGTSKLNYLDPRISVAWCKKWEVPIEKVYNKTQREKFRWAIDMATADFRF
ncbi:DNA topoisomerase I, mitochondrial-like isoform X7 [Dreissena polymorpha]|uniref:DNA topoisomerase I, mitochondrial-like isoform X7 n=1 Tax=Dreissena polymorpha TaxID=45954 RepID=UPI0022649C0B|nr:DNA topoisomerase I, mitochondrial-like isoform X7 [Dreissena polymorpha]